MFVELGGAAAASTAVVATASTVSPDADANAARNGKSAADLQSRLARKAASARLARARHKSQVANLEETVANLTHRVAELEAEQLAAKQAWAQQLRAELQNALPVEHWTELTEWLQAAAPSAEPPERELIDMEEDATLLFRLSNHASPRFGPTCAPLASRPLREGSDPIGAVASFSTLRAQQHAMAIRTRRQKTTEEIRRSPQAGAGVSGVGGLGVGTPLGVTEPFDVAVGASEEPSPTTVMATHEEASAADAEMACAMGIVRLGTPRVEPLNSGHLSACAVPLLELDDATLVLR